MKAKEKIFGITVNEWCPFNGRKIGEVGDFRDEISNRSLSTPILPILC